MLLRSPLEGVVLALLAAACAPTTNDEVRPAASATASATMAMPRPAPIASADGFSGVAVPTSSLPEEANTELGHFMAHKRMLLLFGPRDDPEFARMRHELARATFELSNRRIEFLDMTGNGDKLPQPLRLGWLMGAIRARFEPFPGETTVVLVDKRGVIAGKWRGPVGVGRILHVFDNLASTKADLAEIERKRNTPPSSARGECTTPEVLECLARFSNVEQIEEAIAACFSEADKSLLAKQGQCLPHTFATDPRNGKDVELVYHCSDVCPNYGGVSARYVGVTQNECCALGRVTSDPAWGGYRGCAPAKGPPGKPPPTKHKARLNDGVSWHWVYVDPCTGHETRGEAVE